MYEKLLPWSCIFGMTLITFLLIMFGLTVPLWWLKVGAFATALFAAVVAVVMLIETVRGRV